MADLRESFATLQDATTEEGKALIARIEGEAAAAQNGAIGFAFKDSSGNVVLPALNAAGNLGVSVEHDDLEGDVASGKDGLVAFSHKDSAGNLVLPSLDALGNSKVVIDHKDLAGDAAAGKEGLVGFSFKDSSNNLVLPTLLASGAIAVSAAVSALRKKSTAGELAAGSATLANVTGASISLTVNKVYYGISAIICSRRDSLFQLVQVDDATSTILAEAIVGAGQYTFEMLFPDMQITAGATGTQTLKIMAKNFEALSSLRATLTANEVI
jgi:hypothetical protein